MDVAVLGMGLPPLDKMSAAQTSNAPLLASNKSSFSGGNRKASLSDGEQDCGVSRANAS